MKKLISTFMIVTLLICCFTATAFASDQTVLTTTVPDATYTLNIPADQEIPFGTTGKNIGTVEVKNASGFAKGKDIKITATYDEFVNESVETTIPYNLEYYFEYTQPITGKMFSKYINLKEAIYFKGQSDGSVQNIPKYYDEVSKVPLTLETILFSADSEDWGKALGGEYSSTITFTSEIVVSE